MTLKANSLFDQRGELHICKQLNQLTLPFDYTSETERLICWQRLKFEYFKPIYYLYNPARVAKLANVAVSEAVGVITLGVRVSPRAQKSE
jgi:hypothetical protein